MPNIASVLKAEIVRLARKELRSEVDAIKKSLAAARADSASLKRRVSELERSLKQAARTVHSQSPRAAQAGELESADQFRFRASGMASNRKRLGLSAADFGLLVGASGQSVYAWEQGKARPRGKNLAAIAALRGISKREVAQRLASLKSTGHSQAN
ncbi:MAG: helix-turn-helix domain-containing protein [Rubrivivax sp.]|nr:helix-turn-helix domain-containing protein [Rubrivivax sp.]